MSLDYPVSVTSEPLTPDASTIELACSQSGQLSYRGNQRRWRCSDVLGLGTLLSSMELSCEKKRCTGPLPLIAHAQAIDYKPSEGGRVDDRVEFVCDEKWAPSGDGEVTTVCWIDEEKSGGATGLPSRGHLLWSCWQMRSLSGGQVGAGVFQVPLPLEWGFIKEVMSRQWKLLAGSVEMLRSAKIGLLNI